VQLESRDVPALWNIEAISPLTGDPGSTDATHTGSLNLTSTTATGATAIEALSNILDGFMTVTFQGQTESKPFTVGTGDPFRIVTVDSTTLRVEFEDLAIFGDAAIDWDYNDRTWDFEVIEDTTPVVGVTRLSDAVEGREVGLFHLTRSGDTATTISVDYTLGGPATEGTDYTELGGSVFFEVGQSEAFVELQAVDDTSTEGDETVEMSLSTGSGYQLGTPSVALITIRDDEPPTAINDSAITPLGVSTSINVISNDLNPRNRLLTVAEVGLASNGSVVIDGEEIHYTPNTGFTGSDSFIYTISDGTGHTSTATVTVDVTVGQVASVTATEDSVNLEDGKTTIDVAFDIHLDGVPDPGITFVPVNYRVSIYEGLEGGSLLSTEDRVVSFATGTNSMSQTVSLTNVTSTKRVRVDVLPSLPGDSPYQVNPAKEWQFIRIDLPKKVSIEVDDPKARKDNSKDIKYTYTDGVTNAKLGWIQYDAAQKVSYTVEGKKIELWLPKGASAELTRYALALGAEEGEEATVTPPGFKNQLPGPPIVIRDNRSHLIAKRFGGRDIVRNIAALDRAVNDPGMKNVEDRIEAYVKVADQANNNNFVLRYFVTVAYDKASIAAIDGKVFAKAADVPNLATLRSTSVTMTSNTHAIDGAQGKTVEINNN
jgi:hypothetical protein